MIAAGALGKNPQGLKPGPRAALAVDSRAAMFGACVISWVRGGVAERSKAHAWRACIRVSRIVGSNPTPSATILIGHETLDLYGFHGLSFALYHTR